MLIAMWKHVSLQENNEEADIGRSKVLCKVYVYYERGQNVFYMNYFLFINYLSALCISLIQVIRDFDCNEQT